MVVSDVTTFLFVVPSYKFYETPPMLRYQFIGQSEDKVKRGPDAPTTGLSYDRSQSLKGLRRYDDGLTQSLDNARRRVVRLKERMGPMLQQEAYRMIGAEF